MGTMLLRARQPLLVAGFIFVVARFVVAPWDGFLWFGIGSFLLALASHFLAGIIDPQVAEAFRIAKRWRRQEIPKDEEQFRTEWEKLKVIRLGKPGTQMRVMDQWFSGVRARDWDSEDVAKLAKSHGSGVAARLALRIAYYHTLDTGRFADAKSLIDREWADLEKYPGVGWEDEKLLSRCEQVYIRARLHEHPVSYEHLLPTESQMAEEYKLPFRRAQAALAMAQGREKETRELVALAVVAIHQRYPVIRGNIQAELEWLDAILEKAAD